MPGRNPHRPAAPEIQLRALRAWLDGLPSEMVTMVAREARVHVQRRDRGRLPALLLERQGQNPYVRAVLERWLLRSHENLLDELREFTGPDGVAFLRQLQQENALDVPTLAWLLAVAANPALEGAGALAFPDWPQTATAGAGANGAPRPEPEAAAPVPEGPPETRRLRRRVRDLEEELRRAQAALARREKDVTGLGHRLDQSQRRLAEEVSRRQAVAAELERVRQHIRDGEGHLQVRLADAQSALQRERASLTADLHAAQRAIRERDEALQDAARRLRRTRVEADRYRTMYMTLEAYLEVTAPRPGALPPEAFLAYGQLLEQQEAELLARLGPGSGRDLAPRVVALQHAQAVHADLTERALELPDPEDEPPLLKEVSGPLHREEMDGRERFYIRLPDRYHPVDAGAVTAVGAFPGDVLAVEPRCEVQAGGAHFYLFYHLRQARPRAEEIGMVQSGPPWMVSTSRGLLPLLGAGERRLEAGQPVVVAYPLEGPEGCLLLRQLPYEGAAPPRPPAARRPEPERAPEPERPRRPPLLEGRTIYILGGEGFEVHYRQVVESYGGRLLWTSGFGELRQIVHRVRQADAVVLVTRGVSHKAFDHLQAAVAATGRPLFYCNALGQSQLERVLEQEVIPNLAGQAVEG